MIKRYLFALFAIFTATFQPIVPSSAQAMGWEEGSAEKIALHAAVGAAVAAVADGDILSVASALSAKGIIDIVNLAEQGKFKPDSSGGDTKPKTDPNSGQNGGGTINKLPCCFVAGTPVKTVSGYKKIEELKVGDEVLSQNVETGIIETNVVTDTHIRPTSEIKTFYKLTVGSNAQSEGLFVTGEHPFWVTDKQAWVSVDDIEVGAKLTNHQGEELWVQGKVLQSELRQTYNITVSGNNNYFAGKLETLVHNCGAKEFGEKIARLPPSERVAVVKTKMGDIARTNGWPKDSKLSRINGRDVYKDPKTGNYYAVDSQHGHFEVVNKRGKHQGSIDIDGNTVPSKQDPSGGHDLIVK